jgi:uncharacterized protein YciI
MRAHAAYWRGMLAEGKVVVFGPVADPTGAFGMGVVVAASDDELKGFQDNDPAIIADIGLRYDAMKMLAAVWAGNP